MASTTVDLDVVQAGPGAGASAAPAAPHAVFFYDLASPDCYLVAERIRAELPVVCEWEPVDAAALALPDGTGRRGERSDPERLAARAAALELLPLRLPVIWPPDSALALRVATYAKAAGKSIAYSLAAFRQAFAGGRDLGEEATVLLAAAACEIHPTAALKGAALKTTAAALAGAGERARAAGVPALPAFALADGLITSGPGALEDALAALSG
ncbi:MAG TPA: DsbA family protein [Solirubrobacteraceae bacterium]|nr:DsbA family protein [Solirubrobacteraceae bacterium]